MKRYSEFMAQACLIAFVVLCAATCGTAQRLDIAQPSPEPVNKIYKFKLPVKKWVAPTVKGLAFVGSFAGGVCHGKAEWDLSQSGWPRSTTNHLWRDAGNWITGGSCMMVGVGVMLNGKTDWKECLWNGLAMGASNWVGTRIGYYKLR